jgi:hypothetical protein
VSKDEPTLLLGILFDPDQGKKGPILLLGILFDLDQGKKWANLVTWHTV